MGQEVVLNEMKKKKSNGKVESDLDNLIDLE
jgi:hypothetical protein